MYCVLLTVFTVILFAHCVCMHGMPNTLIEFMLLSGDLHSVFILRWL